MQYGPDDEFNACADDLQIFFYADSVPDDDDLLGELFPPISKFLVILPMRSS